jgi:hypothetical protein
MKSILNAIAQFFLSFGGLRKKNAEKITGFYFVGSSASWVSQGRSELLTPQDGWAIKPSVNSDGNVVSFRIENSKQKEYWNLDFASPKGKKVHVGEFDNSTRYPFQQETAPGLDFSGCHRGNNRLTGRFSVIEAVIRGNEVISFAADFTQYDEDQESRWNFGCIRFNSNISFTPPAEQYLS